MASRPGILVTGGAGYIGSHVVQQLSQWNETVIVLDDLSTGFAESITYGKLIEGKVGDKTLVTDILKQYKIDTVLHFAAKTVVPESVRDPIKYFQNNTASTLNLLACCQAEQVKNFVFSSTAAVYGIPSNPVCTEATPTLPINPYGASKLMSEQMLSSLSHASHLRHVILRYFNVAGCDPEGRIGQSTKNATLLTKVAVEAAVGKRSHVCIFGTDYDTTDGTGVRDYIHVQDLADAHIQALKYLRTGGDSITLNCGYGHGFSVREVLSAVERAAQQPLTIKEEPRRAGDPPCLIAQADKIRSVLNWQPKHDDLDTIVESALNWERKLMRK